MATVPSEQSHRAQAQHYEALFRVRTRHGYYNKVEFHGAGLQIRPTSTSVELMQRLGLLFVTEATGFAVLYPKNRANQLLAWLRRDALQSLNNRLDFKLLVRDRSFTTVTELPLTLRLDREAFFWSNTAIYRREREVFLTPLEQMAETLRHLAPTSVRLKPPSDATFIKLRDPESEVRVGSERLPTLAFLSFLLACPPDSLDSEEDIYPVRLENSSEPVATQTYLLSFEARSAFWSYWVIPRDGVSRRLRIETGREDIQFGQAHPDKLPDGREALRFDSQSSLQLFQQSPFRFKLRGQRAGSHMEEETLRSPLPVASTWQSKKSEGSEGERAQANIYLYL
ncbi:MAG TPA: hypothetical protein VHL08_00635 [Dongiaceae bacterium]|jgi:hypothetical protein|nr:hypothetical protein [Dongiaceae bacterium]